jgi:hypothetical protein
MSLINISYTHAPCEDKTRFIGFNAATAGLVGLFSTMMSGRFLEKVFDYKVYLFSISIGKIQTLFIVSSFLILAAWFYSIRIVKRKSCECCACE